MAAAIPRLLGYQPSESLVVALEAGKRLVVTACLPLADARRPGVLAGLLARLWDRFPGAKGWFFAISSDGRVAKAALRRVAVHMEPGQIRVLDWLKDSPESIAGLPPVRREDLVARLAGPEGQALSRARQACAVAEARLGKLSRSVWPDVLRRLVGRPPGSHTAGTLAQLAVLAADSECRRAALLAVDSQNAPRQRELWAQVVGAAPSERQAPALGILGLAAWASGNTTLTNLCYGRLAAIAPDSPMVPILIAIMDGVVPPEKWSEIRAGLLAQAAAEPANPPAA
jgi:hypothetical protein